MIRLLLVDHDHQFRAALARELKALDGFGLEVSEATSLASALASLEGKPPAIVVAELYLPDGMSVELLPVLRQDELAVPVIFMSQDLAHVVEALPDGDNVETIEKPFEMDDFAALLRKHLARPVTVPPPSSPFSVADYLQLAGMARRSALIELQYSGGKEGRIVVVEGEIFSANDAAGVGIEAFNRMVMGEGASISCKPLETPPTVRNVPSGSIDELLLDAAREADEENRDADDVLPFEDLTGDASPAPTSADVENATPSETELAPNRVQTPPPPPPSAPASASAPAPASTPPGEADPSPAASEANKPPARRPPPPRKTPIPGTAGSEPRTPEAHPTGPKKEAAMLPKSLKPNLNALLTRARGVNGVARAEEDGSVLEMAGEMDAETICAVAAVASRPIEEVTEQLGLGDLSDWHVTAGEATWYVVHSEDGLLVAEGGKAKNPASTMKTLAESVRRGRK